MQRIVLATGNVGKQRELSALLAPLGCTLLLQRDLGVDAVDETGSTFEANALLKAQHAAAITGLPALADDSGLEVDVLAGAPGVRSARYAGEHASDGENLVLLLQRLQDVPPAQRTARFRCVIALVTGADDPAPLLAAGVWEGHIALVPQGDGGFGYDPVFVPAGSTQTLAQWSAAEKNAVSHRAQALQQLLQRWPGSLR
jgi:XTP/dITP diphosphohydrolase